ncbi:MAG: PDDEXK nuclease domain-containing protein [Propionicimonas sp.]
MRKPNDAIIGKESDGQHLAHQLVKDPYVFDFLTLTERAAERDLEDALIANLQRFLLELGHGFAFVARQYRFTVAGDDFGIDLLFFNYVQNRFVVFELKVDKFRPSHAGQLGMYVAWVQQNLAGPSHRDTIGILVCADRNAAVVHYALASATAPMAVSTYTYDQLPVQEQQSLPSEADLSTIIEHPIVRGRQIRLAEAYAELRDTPYPDPQQ